MKEEVEGREMTVKFDRQHHHTDSFPAHTEARNAKIKILHRLNFSNVRRIRDKKVKHFYNYNNESVA